jgi:hypothetical protein
MGGLRAEFQRTRNSRERAAKEIEYMIIIQGLSFLALVFCFARGRADKDLFPRNRLEKCIERLTGVYLFELSVSSCVFQTGIWITLLQRYASSIRDFLNFIPIQQRQCGQNERFGACKQ